MDIHIDYLTLDLSFLQIKWISQIASYIIDYYKKLNRIKKKIKKDIDITPRIIKENVIEEQGWLGAIGSFVESFLPQPVLFYIILG